MKIIDILKSGRPTLSYEVFPPKTDAAYEPLLENVREIAALHPDFMRVTYGAGGGTSEYTVAIADAIQMEFQVPALAHFTCVLIAKNSEGGRDDIMNAITDIQYAEFFERVAAKGMGVELNTSVSDCSVEAVLRPYRIALDCGCKFYFGSDAHTPNELTTARARFEAMVDALNLTENDKFAFAYH
jgi:histidinol phosphatase-like PHP family hydrolase